MPEEASLVPIWPVFVTPTLQVFSDGRSRQRREVFDSVAEHAGVSEEARSRDPEVRRLPLRAAHGLGPEPPWQSTLGRQTRAWSLGHQ